MLQQQLRNPPLRQCKNWRRQRPRLVLCLQQLRQAPHWELRGPSPLWRHHPWRVLNSLPRSSQLRLMRLHPWQRMSQRTVFRRADLLFGGTCTRTLPLLRRWVCRYHFLAWTVPMDGMGTVAPSITQRCTTVGVPLQMHMRGQARQMVIPLLAGFIMPAGLLAVNRTPLQNYLMLIIVTQKS